MRKKKEKFGIKWPIVDPPPSPVFASGPDAKKTKVKTTRSPHNLVG
jgi:hypothetical protein